ETAQQLCELLGESRKLGDFVLSVDFEITKNCAWRDIFKQFTIMIAHSRTAAEDAFNEVVLRRGKRRADQHRDRSALSKHAPDHTLVRAASLVAFRRKFEGIPQA